MQRSVSKKDKVELINIDFTSLPCLTSHYISYNRTYAPVHTDILPPFCGELIYLHVVSFAYDHISCFTKKLIHLHQFIIPFGQPFLPKHSATVFVV